MNSSKEVFLAAAHRIGAQLCRDALWAGSCCNWLGPSLEPVGNATTVVERAFGPDLYNGTSGIALFLIRLYSLTGEPLFRTTAVGAINHAWSQRVDIPPHSRMGFYSGWIGLVYARLAIADTLGNERQIKLTLDLVRRIGRKKDVRHGSDVISGSAGTIPVLLEFYRKYEEQWLLDQAAREGEHLLQAAWKTEHGWSWKTLEMRTRG